MKLHFTNNDSIYHILFTLKKLPSYKKVLVFIENEHILFDHIRRGKQLEELIIQHHLQIHFLVETKKQRDYYISSNLPYRSYEENIFVSVWNKIYSVFLYTKNIHTDIGERSKMYGVLLLSECLLLLFLVRVLWRFISPNTIITIMPHYTVDTLAINVLYATGNISNQSKPVIPLYTGSISFHYNMSLTTDNIKYSTQPAQGEVTIFNYLPYEVKLIKDSQIVSDDGSLYKTVKEIILFASDGITPTHANVRVIAKEFRENGTLIGQDGNKKKGTTFNIKNLEESMKEHKIFAQASKDFVGGVTKVIGSVLEQDIKSLESKIQKHIYDERMLIVQEQLHKGQNKNHIILPFFDFVSVQIESFSTNVVVGETTPFIDGTIQGTMVYNFVLQKDLEKKFMEYIKERSSPYILIKDINYNTVSFETKKYLTGGIYMIPTTITITQQYDFIHDPYNIIKEIREKISNLSKKDAEHIILGYDSVAKTVIKITPRWYSSVSSNPERIDFFIASD